MTIDQIWRKTHDRILYSLAKHSIQLQQSKIPRACFFNQQPIEISWNFLYKHNQHLSKKWCCFSFPHVQKFVKKQLISQEVHIAFINSSRGLACCVDLPNLAVLSTDQTFRPREDAEGGDHPFRFRGKGHIYRPRSQVTSLKGGLTPQIRQHMESFWVLYSILVYTYHWGGVSISTSESWYRYVCESFMLKGRVVSVLQALNCETNWMMSWWVGSNGRFFGRDLKRPRGKILEPTCGSVP